MNPYNIMNDDKEDIGAVVALMFMLFVRELVISLILEE